MSRSEQGAPTQPPLALSAERLDVTLLLPIGSEPGPHDVRLLGAGDQVLAQASGQADIRAQFIALQRVPMHIGWYLAKSERVLCQNCVRCSLKPRANTVVYGVTLMHIVVAGSR